MNTSLADPRPAPPTGRGPSLQAAEGKPIGGPAVHDLRGGLVTLLGSVYIVALIPMILGAGAGAAPQTSVAGTALACAVGTLLFALVTKLPFAVGPGIVPASVVASFLAAGIPFEVVMGIELVAGLAFVALVASGALQALMRRTPAVLKNAGQIAIGFYLVLAALRATGILPAEGAAAKSAVGPEGLLFLFGLAVVFLLHRSRRLGGYAMLIGMAVATAGAAAWGLWRLPGVALKLPELHFAAPDLRAALQWRYLDEALILLYVVIVDVVATLETIATCAPELRAADGRLRHFDQGLFMSAAVFLLSPLLGSVPMLVLFESLGGVMSGARTRRAALLVALGFAALVFLAPWVGIVPPFACAVALGFIGCAITQHAAAALPGSGPSRGLGIALTSVAVVAMIVTHSVAPTLFALFAVYPFVMFSSGVRPQIGAIAASVASLVLVSLSFA